MSMSLSGTFDSRRQADLAVERLVQELGIERTDIFITPVGAENSAGSMRDGADGSSIGQSARDDAALAGAIMVSVDLQNDGDEDRVTAALREFGAEIARS